jgi:hypothetical protein
MLAPASMVQNFPAANFQVEENTLKSTVAIVTP